MNQNLSKSFQIEPIGYIKSPYKEKFAVPRQPGLAPNAISTIEFYPPFNDELAFIGLEGFSHLHVLFIFDKVDYQIFRPKVRPPRLGGNQSVGVFATRSPFRPNRIGLSIVKLNRIIKQKGKVSLEVIGADLVDGTPIVDVKPYIPFVDSVKDAVGGFAKEPPKMLLVEYKDDTKEKLLKLGENEFLAIEQSLRQDPRPAYKEKEQDTKIYQARLYEMVISFVVKENTLQVIKVEHA